MSAPSPAVSAVDGARAHARERRLAELGILAVMVLWAMNFIVVKSAVAVLPPVGFTFLRYRRDAG